jgi:protein ImuB
MMKRYLSLWFPDWPLDRLRRQRLHAAGRPLRPASVRSANKRPVVLTESGQAGLVVAAANCAALKLGITPGLRFTDARARVPELLYDEIDREADARGLRTLGDWMVRWTPLTALDGADGLMLETTGCDHLHGGEAAMIEALSQRLVRSGYAHRIGLAGTPGAASALARAAAGKGAPVLLPEGAERDGLADLPVAALRLSAESVILLRRFGLVRIGQLYGIDRKALARRFQSREMSDAVCLRLDQALGLRPEPLRPLLPPPAHAARLPCPEPIASSEGVAEGLRQLTDTLCADLARLGQGARSFTLHAFKSDGDLSSLSVSAARTVRNPSHILRLFRETLDSVDPGFGIDLLLLEARRTGPMSISAVALSRDLAASDMDEAALAALADRIVAKLGEGSVRVNRPQASHAPDRAECWLPYDGALPPPACAPAAIGPRPVRILSCPERVEVIAEVPDGPPLRFVWRRIVRTVLRADGPERINPEWWRSLPPVGAKAKSLPRSRDYYRVEDSKGARYWLFREGLYDDDRGGAPEWYVQGLFA